MSIDQLSTWLTTSLWQVKIEKPPKLFFSLSSLNPEFRAPALNQAQSSGAPALPNLYEVPIRMVLATVAKTTKKLKLQLEAQCRRLMPRIQTHGAIDPAGRKKPPPRKLAEQAKRMQKTKRRLVKRTTRTPIAWFRPGLSKKALQPPVAG